MNPLAMYYILIVAFGHDLIPLELVSDVSVCRKRIYDAKIALWMSPSFFHSCSLSPPNFHATNSTVSYGERLESSIPAASNTTAVHTHERHRCGRRPRP
jgi:hypothetical protein